MSLFDYDGKTKFACHALSKVKLLFSSTRELTNPQSVGWLDNIFRSQYAGDSGSDVYITYFSYLRFSHRADQCVRQL